MSTLAPEQKAYEQSALYRLRHSAAHLMAQAVTELFPGSKLSIGPPIENGFYYDIDFPSPLKEEDLGKIEQELMALVPQPEWTLLSHLLIWHGRRRCAARKPDCPGCELRLLCPRTGVKSPKK